MADLVEKYEILKMHIRPSVMCASIKLRYKSLIMGALHTYQMATLKVGTETVKYIQKKVLYIKKCIHN